MNKQVKMQRADSDRFVTKLVKSGSYMRTVMNSLEDEMLVIDRDFKILDANKAVLIRHGKSKREILGRNCYEISHGLPEVCCPPYHECPIKVAWGTGKPYRTTHVHVYNGDNEESKKRYLDIIASPIKDKNGEVVAVVELMRDVSAAKEMELQLTESHHNLVALNAIASAVSQSLNLDTVLNTALNKTLEVLELKIGCVLLWDESRQALCYRVHQGLSGNYVDQQFCSFGEGIAGRVAKSGKPILLENISSDARDIDQQLAFGEGLRACVSVPLIARGKVLGVLSIASRESRKFSSQDIQLLDSIAAQVAIAIENAKLHSEVQRKDEMRGELLGEILAIQEEERIRIARELHDETSQAVAGLVANLEATSGMLDTGIDKIRSRIKDAQAISVNILDEIHKIIYELRPTLLDDLGLVSAIRWLIDKKLRAIGISVHFRTNKQQMRLSSRMETTIFRVVQEAVSNIARHANAKVVSVSLNLQGKGIKLKIKDNGRGFDVEEAINSSERPRGLGLLGMKERIELVNGTMTISSVAGYGTELNISIPLDCEVV